MTASSSSGCSKQTTAKYVRRPSPPYPANKCRGQTKRGNDGHMYESVPDCNGVHRWQRVSRGTKAAAGTTRKAPSAAAVDCAAWRRNPGVNPSTGRKIGKSGAVFKRLKAACGDSQTKAPLVTALECAAWRRNPGVNPSTGRKIGEAGAVFKRLKAACDSRTKAPRRNKDRTVSLSDPMFDKDFGQVKFPKLDRLFDAKDYAIGNPHLDSVAKEVQRGFKRVLIVDAAEVRDKNKVDELLRKAKRDGYKGVMVRGPDAGLHKKFQNAVVLDIVVKEGGKVKVTCKTRDDEFKATMTNLKKAQAIAAKIGRRATVRYYALTNKGGAA